MPRFLRDTGLILSVILLFSTIVLAAEEITITTYYPSPYGSYNQLQTNRLAVGDANNNGSLDAADQPNRDGDIRLKAQAGNPVVWPAGATGQFAYSSMDDSLYHYNGSAWVAAGGGGKVLYQPKCAWKCLSNCPVSYPGPPCGACTPYCANPSLITCIGSCTPPACASGYTDLGTGCAANSVVTDYSWHGAAEGYCERYCVQN